jgi:UDP-N-acetylglucosamine:LPS N-acetylglucosamine transferase
LGRAGANTVYEMCVLAKPSIFIPIPWVTNNEQFENAKSLRDLGLSEIIDEKDFKDIDLKKKIDIEAKRLPTEKFNKDLLQNKFPTNAVEKVLNDMYT